MPEVQQLYNDGDLAFVSNVGTLVEPTTKQSYDSGVAKLPVGLFSHIDQIAHWQTSVPDKRTSIGWGGRTADLLKSLNTNGLGHRRVPCLRSSRLRHCHLMLKRAGIYSDFTAMFGNACAAVASTLSHLDAGMTKVTLTKIYP